MSMDLAMGEVSGVTAATLATIDSDEQAVRVLREKQREGDQRVASLNNTRIMHEEIGTGRTASVAGLCKFVNEIYAPEGESAVPCRGPGEIHLQACTASPSCHLASQANTRSAK